MTFLIEHVPDSFKPLRELPRDLVDVVITDPPYDAHVHANITSGTAIRDAVRNKLGGVPTIDLDFAPVSDYAFTADLARISKRWAIVFCALEAFGDIRRAVPGKAYKRSGYWYKPNAMGQLTADRPASAGEGIACLHEGPSRWNGKGSFGFWPCNSTRGKKGRHDNEKPIELCLKLVALFSDRGETILDPFCGSGAIGEAALRLGRNYIGWDSDPKWVESARARLAEVGQPNCPVFESDEYALNLCKAKKPDILEDL